MTETNQSMTLSDLKARLKIPDSDTSQDSYLQATLDDALDLVKEKCRSTFANGLPGGVKRAIVLLVKSTNESNVASQSLGDMSKSFFKGESYNEALEILEDYIGYDEGLAAFGGKKVSFVVASGKKRG